MTRIEFFRTIKSLFESTATRLQSGSRVLYNESFRFVTLLFPRLRSLSPPPPLLSLSPSLSRHWNEKLDTVTARLRNFIVKQFRLFHAARLYLFI